MRDAERPESPQTGRVLLGAALLLAVGATAMLILADDVKWLRLGIVASLWSALVGAFVAAKYRKQVADREDEAADLQAVYELELEREVAARREFELEVETESRRKSEQQSKDELDSLRKEVLALRESLQTLFGGEVLFERVALHAESTRMRSLTEDSRPLTVRQSGVRRIAAAQPDRETELIDRVHVARQPNRQAPKRPEPRRPEPSRSFAGEGSERWFAGPPSSSRADDLAKTIDPEWTPSWETSPSVRRVDVENTGTRTAEAEPPARRRTAEQTPARRAPEPTGYRPADDDTGQYRPVREKPAAPVQASGYRLAEQTGSHPVATSTGYGQPAASGYRLAERTGTHATPASGHRLAEQTGSRSAITPPAYRPAQQTGSHAVPAPPPPPPSRHGGAQTSSYRSAAEQVVHDRSGYAPSLEQSTSYAEPSGRRAAAGTTTGHHAVHDEPGGSHSAGGRRRADDTPPAGSHASGTSVSDLLAAHGQGASPRRRRRRDDD